MDEVYRRLMDAISRRCMDEIINDSELSLLETPDLYHAPMPGSCHPALSHAAEFVRHQDQNCVRIAGVYPKRNLFAADKTSEPVALTKSISVLERKRYVGPAPYVGDPLLNEARYVWSAWVDEYGRAIASEAELEWRY